MKSNLILAFILIIVGSFAYWFEFQKKPHTEKIEEESKKLFAFAMDKEFEFIKITDKVKNSEITIACREKCKLNDVGARWEITSPVIFKAEESNVSNFLSTLITSNIDEKILFEKSPEEDLVKFGLGKDRRDLMKVELKLKGQPEVNTFFLGDDAAVGESAYVYATGPTQKSDQVLMVTKAIKTTAQKGLNHWRMRKLIDFASSEVTGVKVTNTKGSFELVKENSGWFYSPQKIPADSEATEAYITGLVYLSAQDFVGEEKNKDRVRLKLPSKPVGTVVIKVNNGDAPLSVELFEVKNAKDPTASKLYGILGNKNFIVELEKNHREKFEKSAENFKFKSLILPKEKDLVRSLAVDFEEEKTSLEFKTEDGKSWNLVKGKVDNFDTSRVQDLAAKILTAKIQEYKGKASLPKDFKKASKWVLKSADQKSLLQFSLFTKPQKTEYYLELTNSIVNKEYVKIDKLTAENLFTKSTDFQKKP